MKIRPVILCGGSGTRLWKGFKKFQAKQFIDLGGWNLFCKCLERLNSKHFDFPIISTNKKYLKEVKKNLKKIKIKKYIIVLEPEKKNTAPAILSSILVKDIPMEQPVMFFPADHMMENFKIFVKKVMYKIRFLNDKNIFLFGIKPNHPSSQYGYLITKKNKNNIHQVSQFIEKPNKYRANKLIKKKAYWNSGIFLARKKSILKNFRTHSKNIYEKCIESAYKGIYKNKTLFLNKKIYNKINPSSFDISILEKSNEVMAITLSIPWSDLGSWSEITKIFHKNKNKYFNRKNVYLKPWGKYVNLFRGKNFLVKELQINSKSSISLQKHFHRSEYWTVTQGKPKITINKKISYKNRGESVFINSGDIHRIENKFKVPVKIMEVQTGLILQENDIVRYKDIYGRIK